MKILWIPNNSLLGKFLYFKMSGAEHGERTWQSYMKAMNWNFGLGMKQEGWDSWCKSRKAVGGSEHCGGRGCSRDRDVGWDVRRNPARRTNTYRKAASRRELWVFACLPTRFKNFINNIQTSSLSRLVQTVNRRDSVQAVLAEGNLDLAVSTQSDFCYLLLPPVISNSSKLKSGHGRNKRIGDKTG